MTKGLGDTLPSSVPETPDTYAASLAMACRARPGELEQLCQKIEDLQGHHVRQQAEFQALQVVLTCRLVRDFEGKYKKS